MNIKALALMCVHFNFDYEKTCLQIVEDTLPKCCAVTLSFVLVKISKRIIFYSLHISRRPLLYISYFHFYLQHI